MSRDLFFGHSESQQSDHFPITGHFLGIFWLPPSPMYVLEFTPTACTPHPQSDSATSPWGLQDSTVFGSRAKGEPGLLLPVITRGLGVLLFFFQAPFYSVESCQGGWVCLNHISRLLEFIHTRKKFMPIIHSFQARLREADRKGGGTDKQTDRHKKDSTPALHKTANMMMLPALVWRIRSSRPSPCLRLHKDVPQKTNKQTKKMVRRFKFY